MPYNPEMTWKQWSQHAESHSTQLINAIEAGENRYQKWLRYKGADANSVIAANLGKTTADIDTLHATMGAFHFMWEFMTNNASTVGDHKSNFEDFSA